MGKKMAMSGPQNNIFIARCPGGVKLLEPDERMNETAHSEARLMPRGQARLLAAFLGGGLAAEAWINRHALNPDGVAYLRLAHYYAAGDWSRAISGYWAPLLSWLMVPWLKMGMAPLAAARLTMALSAVVFVFGCARLYQRFGLRGSLLLAGLWASAIVALPWSVENITPDLLAAGLVSFAMSDMADGQWTENPRSALRTGCWWGAAFLSKAACLPLGILTCLALALLRRWRRPEESRAVWRRLALTLGVLILVALPWIALLSARYGEFTFSRSARLNHAMVGPPDMDRFYPFDHGLQPPAPGRVTFWEDPEMPYPDWSPLAGVGNAVTQFKVVARNLPVVVFMLTSVGLVTPVVMVAALCRLRRRSLLPAQVSFWPAAIPVAIAGALYLPGNLLISEQRYFYLAFPLLYVAAAAVWAEGLACRHPEADSDSAHGAGLRASSPTEFAAWPDASRASRWARSGPVILALLMVMPTWGRGWVRAAPGRPAGDCAWDIVARLSSAGISGPVAGSAFPGGRAYRTLRGVPAESALVRRPAGESGW